MGWNYSIDELARFLDAEPTGCFRTFSSVSTDSRSIQPGQVFFALTGEHFDGNAFADQALEKGAEAVVSTRSGKGPRIVTPDTLAALQRFAMVHRQKSKCPIIALTGSCGKTTTKEYLAAVLSTKYRVIATRGNLNNEIGCPLTLLRIDPETECAVIEMGANHPGEIARLCEIAQPTESAVTMVAPAHLEGFGTIERVAEAKGEIAKGLTPNGRFYVNMDDPWCVGIGNYYQGEKIRFGHTGDVVLKKCQQLDSGEMALLIDPIGLIRLPLLAPALANNVLLAIAVGLQHGITEFEEPIRTVCSQSPRLRMKKVGVLEVLDDTYNANPASMRVALEALSSRPGSGKRIAALGEMLELGASAKLLHRNIGEYAAQCGVTHLFVRGPHAYDMIDAATLAGVPHAQAIDDHHAMAKQIHSLAEPGDILLLKGSRGMRMERVLEALTQCPPPHSEND